SAGLPPRSFDLDHYDWPEQARGQLEAAGVQMVDNRRLTRILIGSGLRIPLVVRPAARARRSGEHAAALGLAPAPRDLIVGLHDPAGRRAAQEMLDRLDHLARANGGDRFIGQVMDAPPSSPGD